MKRAAKWLTTVLSLAIVTNGMAVYSVGDGALPSPMEETASDTVEVSPAFAAAAGEEILEWREEGIRHYYLGDGRYQAIVTAESTVQDGDAATASTNFNGSVFLDSYITSTNPNGNYGNNSQLKVGTNQIAYMKCDLPELPDYAHVENAKFYFWYSFTTTTGTLNLRAYAVTFPWDESSLNWTTANSHTNFGMSTQVLLGGAGLSAPNCPKQTYIDITNVTKQWLSDDGIPNYGIALKRVGGSNDSVNILSSEAASTYRPYAVITYSLEELPVEEGTYYIRNGYHHNLFMRANTETNDWDDSSTGVTSGDKYCEMLDPPTSPSDDVSAKYKWTFTYLNNGYYSIRSYYDGTYLTVRQGKENTGNFILDRDQVFSGYNNQQWKITKNQDNRYKIEPRSSESYTTDWVMAVKSGNDDLEKGYNVIQAVNSGTAHGEWYIQPLNITPRVTLDIFIEHDSLTENWTNYISEEFQKTAYQFLIVYGIGLEVQGTTPNSSIAVNSLCPVASQPRAICNEECGALDECGNSHHKHVFNFCSHSASCVYSRVCRVVGFVLCGTPQGPGSHRYVGGGTYGSGKQEFVVTAVTPLKPNEDPSNENPSNENLSEVIQHELSHTFGTEDHYNPRKDTCVMGSEVSQWCRVCYDQITSYVPYLIRAQSENNE